MPQQQFWKTSIKELARLQTLLLEHGGSREDPDLHEEIIMREIKLLKSFGLPDSPEFTRLITFDKIPADAAVEEKVRLLKEIATTFLLADAKSEITTLKQAKTKKLSPFDVLPTLNIKPQIYTIFVYDKILLAGKDSIENVWEELKITGDPQVIEYTNKMGIKHYDFEKRLDYQKLLEGKGLRYLRQFINAQTTLLSDDDY